MTWAASFLGEFMAKKNLEKTPRYIIKRGLRLIWMRSRERSAALKRDNYTCVKCNKKQTMAKGKEFKVQVHHKEGIDWEDLIDLVTERLLQDPSRLETQCKGCHKDEH